MKIKPPMKPCSFREVFKWPGKVLIKVLYVYIIEKVLKKMVMKHPKTEIKEENYAFQAMY